MHQKKTKKRSESYLVGRNGIKGMHAGVTPTTLYKEENDKAEAQNKVRLGIAVVRPLHLDNLLKARRSEQHSVSMPVVSV